MSPLVPYLELPELPIVSARFFGRFPEQAITLKPFGMLVALGAYTGTVAALRQARRLGMSDRAVLSFTGWVAVSSFFFAHFLDALFYYPRDVLADPLFLFRLWEGLSSFGGFTGALIGAIAWRIHHKAAFLPHADVVASAFPLSWSFGRLGCTVAHDHPGLRSDFLLAVRYPDGGRHDLGFYELLVTVPLALAFLLLRRKPRPWGFYGGVMCTYYAPIRFLFDFLREGPDTTGTGIVPGDARYFGLTPAQWACFPLLVLGITLLLRMKGEGQALPAVPAAFRTAPAPGSGVEGDGTGGDARDER
ncbi:MAG TPA: prolipoprotein diacylglyceryl transferase family protein [Polyangiaceae bacterium]